MRDFTDITIVLDKSGSMAQIAPATLKGFNGFIREQQQVPGDAVVSLYQFNEVSTLCYEAKPIKKVPELEFVPMGGTALLDALGAAIDAAGQRFTLMSEAYRPNKVVFVVITDGEENSSYRYTNEKIREMVKHQTEVYKWQFVFLGADIDSFAVGGSIGVLRANTMNFAKNDVGTQAFYSSVSSNLSAYRACTKADMSFTPEDHKAQSDAGV